MEIQINVLVLEICLAEDNVNGQHESESWVHGFTQWDWRCQNSYQPIKLGSLLFEKGREILKIIEISHQTEAKGFLFKMATNLTTLTVRIIRSFEFRNIKTIVYHAVNIDQKAADFLAMVIEGLLLLCSSGK